jgi:membrane protein
MKFNTKEKIAEFKQFVTIDIWHTTVTDLPKREAFIVRFFRIIVIAIRGINEDKIQLRASGLTYLTLLSLVPMLAMGFGISKGFGLEKLLIRELEKMFAGQQEVLAQSIKFANTLLETTKGGLIAGVGMIVLFYAVMKLFNNIEQSFNDVWDVKKPRTYIRKFTDYFSLMLIAPVFLITASSATVFIMSKVHSMAGQMDMVKLIAPYLIFLMKYVPYVLIWILLMLFYMIIPNTKVQFKAAMIAGILAGTAYQLTQWVYIEFQIGVTSYNAIYGSFAALPLLLVWLQLSWMIILVGAKIAYAVQHIDKYEYGIGEEAISQNVRRKLTLMICHCIVNQFKNGDKALSAPEISDKLHTSVAVVKYLIKDLLDAQIINEVKCDENGDCGYQPALDINKIHIRFILDRIDRLGINQVALADSQAHAEIDQSLKSFVQSMESSDANKYLKEI